MIFYIFNINTIYVYNFKKQVIYASIDKIIEYLINKLNFQNTIAI